MKIAILLLVALVAWGQDAPKEISAEAKKTARIEGVVTNTAGEPVARARIQLSGPLSLKNGNLAATGSYTAETDGGGKFAIGDIEPNQNYTLQSTKTGFVAGRYGARTQNGPSVPLALNAGETLTGLTLRMAQQGAIAGRVVDEHGDPVAGVRVSAQARSYPGAGLQLATLVASAALGATTDDRGVFRIAPVSAGRYYLSASPTRSTAENTDVAMLSTYYPSATDVRGATLLTLVAGQELGSLEVRMRTGRVFSATGKVVDGSGAPVAGAQVITIPAGIRDVTEILTTVLGGTGIQAAKADGTFVVRNLAAGSYEVAAVQANAAANGTQSPLLGMAKLAVVSENVKDVRLVMGSGPVISGTLRVDGAELREILPETKAPANATEQMLMARIAAVLPSLGMAVEGAPLSVGLNATTPNLLQGSPAGMVNADGSFKIDNMMPGEYQVMFGSLPAGVYLKSANFGGKDAISSGMVVGTSGGTLDILLAKNAGQATASVANEKGEPQMGVAVVLWPEDPQAGIANNIRTVATDRKGQAEFRNLRPGKYYVAAFEDVDPGLAQVRDFLTLLQGDAAKVEIQEGSKLSQALKGIGVEKVKAAEEKLP